MSKKSYTVFIALKVLEDLNKGNSIKEVSLRYDIPTATVWRWKNNKCFPQSRKLGEGYNSEYYEDHRKQIIEKVKGQKYGNNYFIVLNRDGNKCRVCYSSTKKLCIHHKDGNRKNNNEDNLITLCRSCHRQVHLASWVLDILPESTRVRELGAILVKSRI